MHSKNKTAINIKKPLSDYILFIYQKLVSNLFFMYSKNKVTVGHELIMWKHIQIVSLSPMPFVGNENSDQVRTDNKIMHP